VQWYRSNHIEIETAGKYIFSKLDSKINKLRWNAVNLFVCGFGAGAIIATIIWFAVWHATGQPDMTGFILK
jgi:hypothetical protein